MFDREMPRVKNGRHMIIQTGKQGNGEAINIGDLSLPNLSRSHRHIPALFRFQRLGNSVRPTRLRITLQHP